MKILTMSSRKAEYDKYLADHIQGVQDSFDKVKHQLDLPEGYKDEIEKQIAKHDASKFTDEEYYAYLDHFYPADGSEVADNDEADIPFDIAWLHHQHVNQHHWQYWVLVRDGGDLVAMDMPEHYVIEMLCDWHSFSRKNPESTAASWYSKNGKKMILSDGTRKLIDKHIKHFSTPL